MPNGDDVGIRGGVRTSLIENFVLPLPSLETRRCCESEIVVARKVTRFRLYVVRSFAKETLISKNSRYLLSDLLPRELATDFESSERASGYLPSPSMTQLCYEYIYRNSRTPP